MITQVAPATDSTDNHVYTRDELTEIIRRAARMASRTPEDDRVSETEMEAIGASLGLERAHLKAGPARKSFTNGRVGAVWRSGGCGFIGTWPPSARSWADCLSSTPSNPPGSGGSFIR